MLKTEMLYSLRDISIIPAISTTIKSRKECNPYEIKIEEDDAFYPIIASPMDSVLDETNWVHYWENKINCIIPRTVSIEQRINLCDKVFCAFSLREVKERFLNGNIDRDNLNVLIDIANGSMLEEIHTGSELKQKYGTKLRLMGGNIGNPQTYIYYDMAGFDYLRVGVGSGNGCLTSTNTAIHYPYASLISKIAAIKNGNDGYCKIIADGGMSGYSDIIKSLALGADYVMCGMIFAKAAKKSDFEKVGDSFVYRGMSTKSAQKDMGNTNLKTAEGRILQLTKEYTLSGWIENFDSYLKSAMSYCDCHTLNEFKTKPICQVISSNASYKINNK